MPTYNLRGQHPRTFEELALLILGHSPEEELRDQEHWVEQAHRRLRHWERKLAELDDRAVYHDWNDDEYDLAITMNPVVKVTNKYIVVKQVSFDSRVFNLPRGPLEAGEAVWHKRHQTHFMMGFAVRPKLVEAKQRALLAYQRAEERLAEVRRDIRRGRVPLNADQRQMAEALAEGVYHIAASEPESKIDWKTGF